MSWTDERVSLLKQLWGEGKTAAEIAKVLGEGVTRNAVIGKAHRLKLSGRASPIQQNKKTKTTPQTQARDKASIQDNVKSTPAKAPKSGGVKMGDLKDRMCRWPIGDPRDKDFVFCGENAIPGLPYCEEHAKMAYQTTTRSRSLQIDELVATDKNIKKVASNS